MSEFPTIFPMEVRIANTAHSITNESGIATKCREKEEFQNCLIDIF